MLLASRLLVAVALAGLLWAPALYADVIPNQYAGKPDAQQKVQARLTEMGFSADRARDRVLRLTDEEAAYFARESSRIQTVGQTSGQEIWAGQTDLLWWEWVFGIAALLGAGYFIYDRVKE